MCGFAGILNSKEKIGREQLSSYARQVAFRGPDSCGIRTLNTQLQDAEEGEHAIFFNRLAIVDLDPRSDQPFEDERYLLVFNGEIYNYHELKNTLTAKGIHFHTTSDTEVLFYLLREEGIDALPQLNGMFAFFWLDKKERRFMVARDRLGIKPLYYAIAGNSFSYGSELHSILRLLHEKPRISQKAVEMYLWMQFVPTPYSIIEGVAKLPPGHFIAASLDNISESVAPIAYWDAYSVISENKSIAENTSLEGALKESLERQLHADVPLGLFLSSGVDSSLLAALVNKYFAREQDINFFTVAFNEQTASNESHDAAAFIRGFNNPHLKMHLLEIDPSFIEQHISDLYEHYDEPFGDSASLLNWVISTKARDQVTVAISGDGADELFWGYPRYNKWQDMGKLNGIPFLSDAISAVSTLIHSFSLRSKMQRAFQSDPVKRHFDLFLMPAFRPYLKKHITAHPMWATKGADAIRSRKDLTAILDIKTYLADAMLYKVDRSSMASSLEVRVPYLDNAIVDYALQLPFEKKSNAQLKHKALLKQLLVDLAPHYDIHKPKKGFSFPLKKWLKENWKEQVMGSVTPGVLADLGLEPANYYPIITNFYEKNSPDAVEVWYLFNLALWKRQFDKLKGQLQG